MVILDSIRNVKGHADEDMVQVGRVRDLDRFGNKMQLTKPLTLGVGEWILGSLMLGVISPEYVGAGIPLFPICDATSLLFREQW